jgi:hypothetical protein
MVRLNPTIVEHKLTLKPDAKLVKQKQRRWRPEWKLKLKEEIMK